MILVLKGQKSMLGLGIGYSKIRRGFEFYECLLVKSVHSICRVTVIDRILCHKCLVFLQGSFAFSKPYTAYFL